MKHSNLICLILVSISVALSCQQNNTTKTPPVKQEVSIVNPDISFGVRGNCGMCKTTIEKAALSVDGVEEASWGIDTKILDLKFKEEFDVETYKAYIELGEKHHKLGRELAADPDYTMPGIYYDSIWKALRTKMKKVRSERDSIRKTITNLFPTFFDDTNNESLTYKIHKAIAKSGYDTGRISANDEDYNNLPGCCQYNREMEIPSKN